MASITATGSSCSILLPVDTATETTIPVIGCGKSGRRDKYRRAARAARAKPAGLLAVRTPTGLSCSSGSTSTSTSSSGPQARFAASRAFSLRAVRIWTGSLGCTAGIALGGAPAIRISRTWPRGPATAAAAAAIRIRWRRLISGCILPHSGILPCFFVGRSTRFVRRASSAAATQPRVSAGSIISSTRRAPAETYGVANVSLYSSINSFRRAS